MSRASLINKIKSNFALDKNTKTYRVAGKCGIELRAALDEVIRCIHSKPAFHIVDFHKDLKGLMHFQKISFNEEQWDAQAVRISLAILCLASNTECVLTNGDEAKFELSTENSYRVVRGLRKLPHGEESPEPTSFGSIIIVGVATINIANKHPVKVSFPLIETDLNPNEHCDPGLFMSEQAPEYMGDCEVEVIHFAQDMSLSAEFKLVRADSVI